MRLQIDWCHRSNSQHTCLEICQKNDDKFLPPKKSSKASINLQLDEGSFFQVKIIKSTREQTSDKFITNMINDHKMKLFCNCNEDEKIVYKNPMKLIHQKKMLNFLNEFFTQQQVERWQISISSLPQNNSLVVLCHFTECVLFIVNARSTNLLLFKEF